MTVVVDIEGELIPRAQARWPQAVVRDELDNNLLDELPTIQITQVPSGDLAASRLARMLVDIDVYAATRQQAFDLAREVVAWVERDLRGSTTSTLTIGRAGVVTLPAARPYENTALRRVGGTFEIFCHPVS
ncbi:phage tail termination protein [Streptomyces sp. enrichment culture]|uniref:phage tail termination protein n=1 Tax=Streptomyces sp. enrichment culture TaxID=1795815 RepID=UPI003F568529